MNLAVRTASPASAVNLKTAIGNDAADIAVVIVTYGTGPIIIETLHHLATAIESSPRAFEVIVVDQPHPHAGLATRRRIMLDTVGVTLVAPKVNTGFGGGCELGALHSDAELIAFVNPDALVPPDGLDRLADRLIAIESKARHPTIVAPVLLNRDGSIQEAGQMINSDGLTTPNLAVPTEPTPIDYASAACWVMARKTHELVGGFDAAYHPAYFEDPDLAHRLRQLGGQVILDPQVQVVHYDGQGTPSQPGSVINQLEIFRTRHPDIAWRYPTPPSPNPTNHL